jgi:exosortase
MTTQEEIAPRPARSLASLPLSAEQWIHGLWLVLFVAVFAPTLLWLFERWTDRLWFNGHNLFIPIVVAWLFRDTLRRKKLAEEQGSALGFVFLVPALSLRVYDLAIHTEILSALALFLALPGLCLLLLGRLHTRALAFPLILTFFMLPFPAAAVAPVHQVLRDITAWGTAQLVPFFGIVVAREGTTLMIPTGVVLVSDACSGFSTFYAAMTLALILASMAATLVRRVQIFVGAIVLAIVCNTIRVTILVLLAHYVSFDLLDTFAHEASGLFAFAVTLLALFLIAGRRPPQESAA